jgi:adenosylmethionine-8-amino-7-oxononanoate aminotransferase
MAKDGLEELDRRHVWHPFTQMDDWADGEVVVIERGEGCYLIDARGRRYFDGVSSLWVNLHGHDHPILRQRLH